MAAPRLEVYRLPCGPLGQAWAARVEDWAEGGNRIIRLSREYRGHYRATVCAKCTPERQARRRCTALREGCSTLSCSHMNRAFYSRYKKIIRARMRSHPMMERIRLNAQLDVAGAAGHARGQAEQGPAGGVEPPSGGFGARAQVARKQSRSAAGCEGAPRP